MLRAANGRRRNQQRGAAPFGHAAGLATDLMAALPGLAVDVVVLNQAPSLLYHRVLRDGVRILSCDLRATTTREGRALSRYCDFVPHLRKIDAAQAARRRRPFPDCRRSCHGGPWSPSSHWRLGHLG